MNTITISNNDSWWDSQWRMRIDLDDVAHNAGRKEKETDKYGITTYYTVYSIPRAKKLLKLIRKYGTEEDFEKVTEAMKNNKKLSDYWDSLQ